jgi:hypothetical protein
VAAIPTSQDFKVLGSGPMLEITTPAADRSLLTMAELRAAVGSKNRADDANLKELGLRVSSLIAGACKVISSGGNIATLRKETLTETFRLASSGDSVGHLGLEFAAFGRHYFVARETIRLARRPILSVASVTECGVALDPNCDYEIESGAGTIKRLRNDRYVNWRPGKIVIVYDGGWATVPDDLKMAAVKAVRMFWATDLRDPALRAKTIPGVSEVGYWNSMPTGAYVPKQLPDDIMAMLGPYKNYSV